ncbi:hypothetical protein COLO4_19092 [Corchorus olitorius]|uniref:Protein kinase domain-containing protein n=1 Tax=Corchorus olitorius TaxID=93759 RepID=A0A1R3J6T0_9ROSI|nr:hypothetical protein COLO4_19092 [Corchorus olitorius]
MKKAAHPSNLQPSWGNQSSSSHHDLPGKFSDKNQHKTRGVRNYFRKLAGVFAILSFGKRKKAVTDHVNKSNSQVKRITFSTSTDLSTGSDFRSSAMFKSFDSYGSSSSASGFIPAPDFSFEDICKATGNFSPANKIGEGGFGTVYKGRLKDGSLVAVKRAKKEKYEQGLSGQFKNEILTLSKIEHLNLVRLYGFLEHKDEQIIVVEYVGNGNLREHLDAVRGNGLEIAERLDIAIDVAHAITYLHTYTGNEEIKGRRVRNCNGPKAKEKSSIKHGGGESPEIGSRMPCTILEKEKKRWAWVPISLKGSEGRETRDIDPLRFQIRWLSHIVERAFPQISPRVPAAPFHKPNRSE